MSVFENKVTRRVALGSIAGSLAAGAIFLRYWRGPKLKEADPYGKINIPPDQIASDLSRSDVEKAFGVLQKERAMWLNFRGVAGKMKVVKETVYADKQAPKTVANEGYVSLNLDLQPATGTRGNMLLPTDIKLVYSDTHNGAPVWSFSLARRDSQSPGDFTGKELESISHGELYQFLTLPLSLLTLVNGGLKEILSAWKVSRNVTSSTEPDSYVFESNGKPISDGLLPTLGFTNGHLSEYVPKRLEGQPFPIISLRDQVVDNGIAYPRVISLSSSIPLPENASIAITLSDIQIATA